MQTFLNYIGEKTDTDLKNAKDNRLRNISVYNSVITAYNGGFVTDSGRQVSIIQTHKSIGKIKLKLYRFIFHVR